jgi:regulator of telomere elongation helicase 1
MTADAELIFTPYNYLVDKKTRSGLGISWENAVLIFDEAHNIEVGLLTFCYCNIAFVNR